MRFLSVSRALFALFAVFAASTAGAQAPDSVHAGVAPGVRVRLTLQSGERLGGTVESVSDTAIAVRSNEADSVVTVVPRPRVRRMEWLAATRAHPIASRVGAGILIGGVTGAVIGYQRYSPCDYMKEGGCYLMPRSRADAVELGMVAGAALGLVVGGLVGLFTPREIWRDAEWPGGVSAGFAPDGRVGVAVRYRF